MAPSVPTAAGAAPSSSASLRAPSGLLRTACGTAVAAICGGGAVAAGTLGAVACAAVAALALAGGAVLVSPRARRCQRSRSRSGHFCHFCAARPLCQPRAEALCPYGSLAMRLNCGGMLSGGGHMCIPVPPSDSPGPWAAPPVTLLFGREQIRARAAGRGDCHLCEKGRWESPRSASRYLTSKWPAGASSPLVETGRRQAASEQGERRNDVE